MNVRDNEGVSLREVMAAYPTGVTIVSGRDEEGAFGLTVNSFTSVSLDPPLVLVCIGRATSSHDRLVAVGSFSINVLAGDQGVIAARFARNPSDGRFDDIDYDLGPSGCPRIRGVVAWLGCSMHTVIDGGDHTIVLGRVERTVVEDRPALVFHRGTLASSE